MGSTLAFESIRRLSSSSRLKDDYINASPLVVDLSILAPILPIFGTGRYLRPEPRVSGAFVTDEPHEKFLKLMRMGGSGVDTNAYESIRVDACQHLLFQVPVRP